LKWLYSVKDLTSRFVWWQFKLTKYEYEIVYKAGKINTNADALSRNPILQLIFPLFISQETNVISFYYLTVSNNQITGNPTPADDNECNNEERLHKKLYKIISSDETSDYC